MEGGVAVISGSHRPSQVHPFSYPRTRLNCCQNLPSSPERHRQDTVLWLHLVGYIIGFRGQCMVAWQKVTQPVELGGLGVLDLDVFGHALRLC
jgi:hypothetical protein